VSCPISRLVEHHGIWERLSNTGIEAHCAHRTAALRQRREAIDHRAEEHIGRATVKSGRGHSPRKDLPGQILVRAPVDWNSRIGQQPPG
jgi:hypothetical protein